MADTVIPDMSALGDQASKVTQAFDGLLKLMKPLYDGITNIVGTQTVQAVSEFTKGLGNISTAFGNIKKGLDDINRTGEFYVDMERGTNRVSNSVDGLIVNFTKLSQFISNAKMFDKFSIDSVSAINDVSHSIDGIQAGLKNLGVSVDLSKMGRVFENAGQAEKLENTYIALSAATGNMNDLFKGTGRTLQDLSSLTAAYTNQIGDVAEATGLSYGETLNFAAGLGKIPDAMNQIIQTGSLEDTKLNSLNVAMKLMSGSGRSQADVVNTLNMAYEKLSQGQGKITNGAQKGAELFAVMSQASSALKLRFDDVKGIMESVADQFKFIGNETDAAARVLGRYTDALRETGLTSKASIDIIHGMIKSVSDLSMGTKAFLSLRSGGPGGLQGAFKVEQMLREGKLDQVMQMMEKSLKQQFGGKIYSLGEAAQSPEAASQFMRQRELLKSSAFGGLAKTDDQATRLLEALGKGSLGGVKDILGGQDALKEVTKQGADIQERNFNELKKANAILERNAVAAEISAGATVRGLFGNNGPGQKALVDDMKQSEKRAGFDVEREGAMRAGGVDKDAMVQEIIISGRRAIEMGMKSAEGIKSGLMAGAGGAKDSVMDMNKYIRDAIGETEEKAGVYAGSLNEASPRGMASQRSTTAAITAQEKGQKLEPRKIILEIMAPEGFEMKSKTKSDDVDINFIQTNNNQSMNPRI